MTAHRILWQKWKSPLQADEGQYRDYEPQGAYHGPLAVGPGGLFPLNGNDPSAGWNLWVGHTNFHISQERASRMAAVDGVEAFKVWSPYRFWVGVGRAFRAAEVKQAVFRASKTASPLSRLAGELAASHEYWAVAVMPGGEFRSAAGENRGDVEEEILPLISTAKRVLTSWGGASP